MSEKNWRDVTSDDFDDVPEVPTYRHDAGNGAAPTPPQDIYERTGKAAPTEVFPVSPAPAPAAAEPTEYLAPAGPAPVGGETAVAPAMSEPANLPARRGTTDFGLLLLRLLVGGYLILDAVRIFFRLGGSAGIEGLENAFAAYAYGDVLAVVIPTLALAAGVFLVLGLIAPVAAMVAVVVSAFGAAHALAQSGVGANPLDWDAALWLPVMLFGTSFVLQFTGPGLYGVDAGRSWARRPLASSFVCAALGVAVAILVWWFGAGVNPLA
ncbi:DoxX family membrane protein [Corynebacterium auris]|uniref:DoxX family membrane protein n=1 Tax=Corynebacterium auris TaxID=44750 RepID=UPI0025B569C7|nr:DoxX family protein [Corynebacterium auris]WJY67875.1 hypothetical protein CAURIS_04800 [Corynebacterium auris]